MERISTGNSSVIPQTRNMVSGEVMIQIGEFALVLREFKKKHGLSNPKLGRILKVSTNTVAKWIHGTSEPRMERHQGIMATLLATEMKLSDPLPKDPNPAPLAEPTDDLPDPVQEAPALRSLLPQDRRWDV